MYPMLLPPWSFEASDLPFRVAVSLAELKTRVPYILPSLCICQFPTLCPVTDWDSSLRSFLASHHLQCINFIISMAWVNFNWIISIILFCSSSFKDIIMFWEYGTWSQVDPSFNPSPATYLFGDVQVISSSQVSVSIYLK